jgi:hypothetical protein
MSPLYSIEYELSEELSARVAEAFLRGPAKDAPSGLSFWKSISILLLCTFGSGALLVLCYLAEMPIGLVFIPAALLGLFGGVLCRVVVATATAVVSGGLARWVIRRRLIRQIPDSYDRNVRWTFANEEFQVHTADKDRQMPWSALRRFRADPEFWFLGVQDGTELILPVENLSNDLRTLILSKTANLSAPAKTADRSSIGCADIGWLAKNESRLKPEDSGQRSHLPFTESPKSEGILNDRIRRELPRKPPISQFLIVIFSLGGTLFLLRPGQLEAPSPSLENLVVIGALMLGASFSIGLLVKRAWRPGKLTLEGAVSVQPKSRARVHER